MANYRQYTQCCDISNFDPGDPIANAALTGLYVTLAPGAFALLLALAGAVGWACLWILAAIWLYAAVVGYCYWFLYRRLICIPSPPDHPADSSGNQTVIGLLIDIVLPRTEPSFFGRLFDFDNDYSIGVLPACSAPLDANPPGQNSQPFLLNNPAPGPYGYLITEQPVTHNAGLNYTGQDAVDHLFKDHPELEWHSQVLHCEFEGDGIFVLFHTAQVALFAAFAALFVCLVIPELGWLAALLALLGLFLLGVAGALVVNFGGGQPTDVNPNIGELHTNDENHTGAYTLMIMGHWVCDGGHVHDYHSLTYELHPVTFCCKTSPVTDCDPIQILLLKKKWQEAVTDATSAVTLENQKLPQNQWQIHPIVDGCQPVIIV
jgi:hypothetical protein